MLQVHSLEQYNHSESQIYQDLSQMIKIFKSLLINMDTIASNSYRDQSTDKLISQLKQMISAFQVFSKQYFYTIDEQYKHKNTFYRFVSRLIESISAYKVKLQKVQYCNLLSNYIRQIQQIAYSFQNERNLGSIIKKIQVILLKFCNKNNKCLQLPNKNSDKQDLEYCTNQKKKNNALVSHEYQTNLNDSNNFTFIINQIKPKRIIQSKSQNSLNKMMNLLNKRYKILSCLDIEYQQFKQLFFKSRDSKNQLYDDCFQRNTGIYREIVKYSKQFSQYLLKRQTKLYRKNKFIDNLTFTNNNFRVKNKNALVKVQDNSQLNYNFTKKKYIGQSNKNLQQNFSLVSQNFDYFQKQQIKKETISDQIKVTKQQKIQINKAISDFNDFSNKKHLFSFTNKQLFYQSNLNKKSCLQKQEQKIEIINEDNIFELNIRKKNLQLKKIDITLSSVNKGFGEVQSAKLKNRILTFQTMKRPSILPCKQMQEKISANIRKNFLQRKNQDLLKTNLMQGLTSGNRNQMKIFDSNKDLLDINSKPFLQSWVDLKEDEIPPKLQNPRKYLIKTSNKRKVNQKSQYKSLVSQKTAKRNDGMGRTMQRQLRNNKIQRIQKLQRAKQDKMAYMTLIGGAQSIKSIMEVTRGINQKIKMEQKYYQENICQQNIPFQKIYTQNQQIQDSQTYFTF